MIKTIITKTENIDVNKEFWFYKYAIPEHEPIKLSDGTWLHTYRLTRYDFEDSDVEQDAVNEEL